MSSNGQAPWIVATLDDVAKFFGRSRETIKDWRKKGMPGVARRWDLSEIYHWHRNAIGSSGRNDDGDESRGEAERRRAWAEAGLAEIKERQVRGELIEVDDVAREYTHHATHARALLEQIPDRLLGDLPLETGGDDKRRFRVAAQKAVDGVIEALHGGLEERAQNVDVFTADGAETSNGVELT